MKKNELIRLIASDLVKDLQNNNQDEFIFGDNKRLKCSEVIKEINRLSPLGNEIIYSWFVGIKQNLDYLNRLKFQTR